MLGGATPGINGFVPSDVVFSAITSRQPGVLAPGFVDGEEPLRVEERAGACSSKGTCSRRTGRDAQPGYADRVHAARRAGAAPLGDGRGRDVRATTSFAMSPAVLNLPRDDNGASGPLRRRRDRDNLVLRRGSCSLGRQRRASCRWARGRPTSWSSTTPSSRPATSSPSTAALARHRARRTLRVPGQHRAAQCQRGDRPEPRDRQRLPVEVLSRRPFHRNVMAGGVAARYPADNLFPTADWLSEQFQDQRCRDYRLRLASSLRSPPPTLATWASALRRSSAPWIPRLPLAGAAPGRRRDSVGRPGDRARGRPPAYIR